MSASVPPLRVSVDDEVGGANRRHGSEACKSREMLLFIYILYIQHVHVCLHYIILSFSM